MTEEDNSRESIAVMAHDRMVDQHHELHDDDDDDDDDA